MPAEVQRIDGHILEAIREAGHLGEGELVTEAVIVYAAVDASRPGSHSYGFVPMGFIAHHSMLGLLDHQVERLRAEARRAGDD